MSSKADISLLYDLLLTGPGMSEAVKVDLKLPRKSILLLSKIIERGMQPTGDEKEGISIMEIVSPDTMEELSGVAAELLQKAGLSEMNEKLNAFRK